MADRVLVMSSAPGRIKARSVPIPFDRPRRAYELKRDPRFGELTYTIWEALRDEVNAARAAEVALSCQAYEEPAALPHFAACAAGHLGNARRHRRPGPALLPAAQRNAGAAGRAAARRHARHRHGDHLRRMAVGFVLAAVPAVLLGLGMGMSRTAARRRSRRSIAALYPVPKIALVPMVVILFGIGETSKYAIVVISVFFLVVINTMAGVINVEERYFDIARNNGATRLGPDLDGRPARQPAQHPHRHQLGLGFALTVIVGTELLLPQGGIGALIWQSYQIYDIATIFAGLIVVALIGWGFNTIMLEVERQLMPWRARRSRTQRRSPPATR